MIILKDQTNIVALRREFNPDPEDFTVAYGKLRFAMMTHEYFLAFDRASNPDLATAPFIDITIDPETETGYLEAYLIIVRLGTGNLKIIDSNGDESFLGENFNFFDFQALNQDHDSKKSSFIKAFLPNFQRLYTACEVPGDVEHGDIIEDACINYLHPTCAAQVRVLKTLFALYASPHTSRRYVKFQ